MVIAGVPAFLGNPRWTLAGLNDVFDGGSAHDLQCGSNFENLQAQKFGLDCGCWMALSGCTLPLMRWWQRLSDAMRADGKSPEAIAEITGIPVKSIYGYLKGTVANPRGDVLRKLASAVGLSEQGLLYGSESQNFVQLAKVPLLTMNKLGTLGPVDPASSVWDGVTMVAVPAGSVSNSAFGVRLTDDSGEPEFSAGEVIICDPEQEPAPGKMVVAAIHRRQAAVFRRYRPNAHFDDGDFTLVAPNHDYPAIEVGEKNPGHVIARAVKHIRDL